AGSRADVEQRLVGHRLHVLDQGEARDAFEVDLADGVVARLLGELAADLGRSGRPAIVLGPAHDQALAAASTGSPARRYASMPPATLRARRPARSSTLAAMALRHPLAHTTVHSASRSSSRVRSTSCASGIKVAPARWKRSNSPVRRTSSTCVSPGRSVSAVRSG